MVKSYNRSGGSSLKAGIGGRGLFGKNSEQKIAALAAKIAAAKKPGDKTSIASGYRAKNRKLYYGAKGKSDLAKRKASGLSGIPLRSRGGSSKALRNAQAVAKGK